MISILLVEDDVSLGQTLKERLEKAGYEVHWATSCEGATQLLDSSKHSLAILDITLPDGSGFDLAKIIKQKTVMPFIFMTAMNTAEYRLEGYELGAEEYIPKPFHLKELLLRVKHVLDQHSTSQVFEIGNIKIHFESLQIEVDQEIHQLSIRDFQLLKLLLDRAPGVVSREEILDRIWGEDKFPSERTVDNAIVRIRQSLKDQDGILIKSIRGVGYQFNFDPMRS